MLTKHLIKPLTLFIFLFLSHFVVAQRAYQVKDIPDPKKNGGGYVSDPDKILGTEAVVQLNNTIADFESKTNVQVAVVMVSDFDHNKEDFDFAYELFNTWGIGSKTSNNGLLLFISKERRKYRFITGTGAEGVLPDVKLKHIAEQNLLPAFRENDFATGISNTINAIGEIILKPEHKSELNQLFTQQDNNNDLENFLLPAGIIILLFWGAFKMVNRQAKNAIKDKTQSDGNQYEKIGKGCAVAMMITFITGFIFFCFGGMELVEKIRPKDAPVILYVILALVLLGRYLFHISALRRIHYDDKNFFNSVSSFHKKNFWLIIFSPFILINIIIYLFKTVKNINRFKAVLDSKGQEMVRLDRDINMEGEPFLTKGQRIEEIVKAYDYDIWESVDHQEHMIKQWPAEAYNSYTECPDCYFRTYQLNKQVTTKKATYSHEGQAKIINECSCCKKTEFIKWITLAMLVDSSSSSGSSSSGSSSSSSSSSSWGGGSSSGGGTGGSW
ncbi:TPM domain-containing protein [Pedobacter sp. KACC 23697]|uniref:TPM domain-containing protein n=1 Tax=Pedobacter sp. KACC 23697 TaxID=3149230 RepID=A0AAU7K0D9_9SPHI